MNKAQELELLRRFIGDHKGTYVADLLADSLPAIEQLISNDLCCGLGDRLRVLQEYIARDTKQLEKVRADMKATEAAATDAERRASKARREIEEIRAAARSLASLGVK